MFELHYFPQTKDEEWTELDEVLSRHKFHTLRSVSLIATNQSGLYVSYEAAFLKVVDTWMPKLSKRGILHLRATKTYTVDLRMECKPTGLSLYTLHLPHLHNSLPTSIEDSLEDFTPA